MDFHLFIAIQANDNGKNKRQTIHNNSLESDTATARRWRCPEHLYPCASSGNALCDGRGAVSHELRVSFIDDLWNIEQWNHTSGEGGASPLSANKNSKSLIDFGCFLD